MSRIILPNIILRSKASCSSFIFVWWSSIALFEFDMFLAFLPSVDACLFLSVSSCFFSLNISILGSFMFICFSILKT